MGLFQLPGSGWMATARDLALIDRLWRQWSPGFSLDVLEVQDPGVEKKFALGSYPDVSLAAARKACDAAKAQKASGINPIQARQVVKLKAAVNTGDTFRQTALEWFDKHHARWSGHYATREKCNLEKDLFPYFAARRISEIEAVELLAALRRVEERGALDVAGRVLMTARARCGATRWLLWRRFSATVLLRTVASWASPLQTTEVSPG
jgi:hypothetical protein